MTSEQRRFADTVEDHEKRLDALGSGMSTANERIEELEEENQRLQETIDELADRLTSLEAQLGSPQGKDAKVAALVEFADNKRTGDSSGAKLDVQEIRGATGCSRRYAYDLVEELPDEFACVVDRQEHDQYGDLQIADNTVGLFVDCELAHEDARIVNHLTTRTGEGRPE